MMRFTKRKKERVPTGDAAYWLRLAKSDCANYSEHGPWNTRHYCCLEPRWTSNQCVLTASMPCKWFQQRILPLHPGKGLEVLWSRFCDEWRIVQGLPSRQIHEEPEAQQPVMSRLCQQCGSRFQPGSNRQKFCSSCSKKNAKVLRASASREYRKRVRRDNLELCESATSAG